MFKHHVILSLILIGFLASGRSWAENAYVTDSFTVTLRTGPSTKNKIIDTLSSGNPVQVLESEGDWTHVQINEDGEIKEGWLLGRYLMTREPFEQQANALLKENNRLREKLSPVEKKLSENTVRVQELTKKLEETSKALQGMERQYESLKKEAADYLALKDAHAAAKSELMSTRKDFESLTARYKDLKSSKEYKWFMTGAGVLLCGLFLGLIFGRREKRRKSYY